VIQRALRNLTLSVAALVAATVGAVATAHAVERGFTGTFTYRDDNFRTGQNLAETVLTPSTVNAKRFGLKFTDTVDGFIYAEPLYVPNVAIPSQGTHNVVYVVTENDSVYAFDADVAGPPLWQTSFIDPANGITAVPSLDLGAGCTDLVPIIGITATPVIDSSTGTLFVVSKVKLGPGSYQQQLHALDIATGLEQPNSPVTITASVPGTGETSVNGVVTFDPLLQHDRAALTLANGVVYLTFASHCDVTPYHGWILGYDETTLAQVVVYNDTPNGAQGGIWESGCGLGVDTNGDLITVTGNGTFDTVASPINYGDSFLRLTPGVGTTGTMTVDSFFTPLNELLLDDEDADMGSGGNLLLPDQPGPNPHLVIGVGKLGTIYLVNRDSMGGFNASMDQMVQELPGLIGGMFSTPAYWQEKVAKGVVRNLLYTIASNDQPKSFVLADGMIESTTESIARNFTFGFPGASPVISANNTTGGIMWAVNASAYKTAGTAILYAFDASNLENELYDSNQNSGDHPGPGVKFTVPTVANGSVYMGTQTQLAVFGMYPSKLTFRPAALAFGNRVIVGTTSKPQTVTITNSGRKRSMPLKIAIESASPPQFAIKSQCEKVLKPGKSCKVSVTFTPIVTTLDLGTLTIVDDAPTSPQSVSLSGTGKPAE
jgi:Abnormal spindle-like microcephaly-assoc'd, ASPM-SPD-2-Hydin